MYLKSLRLAGFKSFAERTRLELEPGVTVVVGPNGSGKSNLADAVAWVMGTQSTRVLRTQRMEDVVFAGTASRPSLGRAEVTLVFDNASRQLPLDLDEVSIRRRLHRDGTSEYEINGVGCRLLDVQDLLSDSGVGRHQHIIVGQGQLDSILNADPEEHRAVIEEAAGILKHRRRKERSLRRLERTDTDLVRLEDIVGEITRQMRPLRRQAEAADRHDGVRAEIRALRLWMAGAELRRSAERGRELASRQASLKEQVDAAEREAAAIDESLDEMATAAGVAGRALDRDTAAAAHLETTAERLRRIGQVAHERQRALEATVQGAGERRRDLQEEARDLERDLAQSADQIRRAEAAADRCERTLRALEDEERSLAEQEALPFEGALAIARADLAGLEAAGERDQGEREDLDRRLEVARSQLAAEFQEEEALQEELRALDAATGKAHQDYDAARQERALRQTAWEEAEEMVRRAELEAASAAASAEALASGGWPAPVPMDDTDGVLGTVIAALDVPPPLTAAVEAALGAWHQAWAVADEARLTEVVGRVKEAGAVGLPLVVADQGAADLAGEVAERLGIDTLAGALGPGADRPLALTLLGDVILVEGWGAAWDIVRRHPALRAVTPEGDLVSAIGIQVGNDRVDRLDLARQRLEAAETATARAASRLTSTRRDFERVRETERRALEELERLEARLAGGSEALERIRRSQAAVRGEVAGIESRRQALQEAEAQRAERIELIRRRLADLEGEESERQRAWDDVSRRRQEVAARRDAARAERQQAASELGAAVERRAMLEARLRTVRAELQARAERPVDPSVLAALSRVAEDARGGLGLVRNHLAALRSRQSRLREEAGTAGARLADARTRREQLREQVTTARDQLAALAVEEAELRLRSEAVREGLRRDADADEEEALAAPPPVEEGEPVERLESLEAELRRMGPVNPLAAEEFRQLEERHRFLREQLDDLVRSRNELKKVIKALDEEIVGLFTAAFDEVAQYFEEQFAVLFPGGRGRLRLSDPTDPLGSGVEIEAQPMGKKVSRLTLLSGGERSLAALAFLFAVFQARPSPFYVLDEVEASLDDANLRRFLRLVDRFRDHAQLVVVTHQQQTMEAADMLYGVTMEPGGSSQVLAKRMRDVPVGQP